MSPPATGATPTVTPCARAGRSSDTAARRLQAALDVPIGGKRCVGGRAAADLHFVSIDNGRRLAWFPPVLSPPAIRVPSARTVHSARAMPPVLLLAAALVIGVIALVLIALDRNDRRR